jgi:hypothetical protein
MTQGAAAEGDDSVRLDTFYFSKGWDASNQFLDRFWMLLTSFSCTDYHIQYFTICSWNNLDAELKPTIHMKSEMKHRIHFSQA